VLGTRPEIIKTSPFVRAAIGANHQVEIIHTGQHYSDDMNESFFRALAVPEPVANLHVGSLSHGAMTGRMIEGLERELSQRLPDAVIVQGDTNSVLAGGLAAAKLGIPVGHIEAGLRSDDSKMPEEINRVLVDHLSTWLFAPTEHAASRLRREGIPDSQIAVTGNTIVDAVQDAARIAGSRNTLEGLDLAPSQYVLATIHRQENTDDARRFQSILDGLGRIKAELGLKVVLPAHPRARARIKSQALTTEGIDIIPPQDYLDFVQLEANASVIITDSGGLQEEACILGVPCVTARDSTERPETIEIGANRLVGADAEQITTAAREACKSTRSWKQPFGPTGSGERIVTILEESLSSYASVGP